MPRSQPYERKKIRTVHSLNQVAHLRQHVQMLDTFNHTEFEYNEYLSLVLFVIQADPTIALVPFFVLTTQRVRESNQNNVLITKPEQNSHVLRFQPQTKKYVDQIHEKIR